jgi:hypothetical protein
LGKPCVVLVAVALPRQRTRANLSGRLQLVVVHFRRYAFGGGRDVKCNIPNFLKKKKMNISFFKNWS